MTVVEQPLSRTEMYEATDSLMPSTPTRLSSPLDPAQIAVTAPPSVASGSVSGTTIVGHARTELYMRVSYVASTVGAVVGLHSRYRDGIRYGRAPNVLMLSRVAAPRSSSATRRVARNEARKRRASERRYVGSCMELGTGPFPKEWHRVRAHGVAKAQRGLSSVEDDALHLRMFAGISH